jgi:hypothetical protein
MSGKFNLNDYELVKARKKRFYKDHVDGRIVVEAVEIKETHAVLKAYIYKNKEEQEKGLPWSTGHAFEQKGAGSFANKTSWTENCEESAVGRALDNAGYAGNDKCSQEEIIQANKHSANEKSVTPSDTPISFYADYSISFGKYKGKKFKEVPSEELQSYSNYIQKTAEAEKKPIRGAVLEFVEAVKAYAKPDDFRF